MKLDQIRWEVAAKIGAGVLLAVAIATTLPSLLDSEKPEPLEPDIGLPQAPALPPERPAPPPPRPAKKPKRRPQPPKQPKQRHHKPHKPPTPKEDDDAPTAPPVSGPAYTAPAGAAEDFGFERP